MIDSMGIVRRLWRLALLGAAVSAGLGLVGVALVRARLGPSDAATLARLERDVQSEVTRITAALDSIADRVAAGAAAVPPADEEPAAIHALFETARRAVGDRPGEFAVTIYGADGNPIAWSGRPADLPHDRLTGPQALFVAPGPLGPRLVHTRTLRVEPETGTRTGTIAVERVLAVSKTIRPPDAAAGFVFPTRLLGVAMRARYEGAGQSSDPSGFVIRGPSGEPLLEGRVSAEALHALRRDSRRSILALVLAGLGVTVLLMAGPLLDGRHAARGCREYVAAAGSLAAALLGARALFWLATPAPWQGRPLFSPATYSSDVLGPLLRSPIDFLLTAMTATGLVVLAAEAWQRARIARQHARVSLGRTRRARVAFLAVQATAAILVVGLLVGYEFFLKDTVTNTSLDVRHFSLHPWSSARLALAFGLVLLQAAVIWIAVLVLSAGPWPWRVRRGARVTLGTFGAWSAALVFGVAMVRWAAWPLPLAGLAAAFVLCAIAAYVAPHFVPRYRHASQAARLLMAFGALLAPTLILYPSVLHFADGAKQQLIETQFGPQAASQPAELQSVLQRSLQQIDQLRSLPDLVTTATAPPADPPPAESAFWVWAQTDLAARRLTSAVELYGPQGSLVSRFALKLPEYASTAQKWEEPGCSWDVFGEVAPFGSEDRRVLHAGRGVCAPVGGDETRRRLVGAIVVHVMLDYDALAFISSQNPYFELFRTSEPPRREGLPGQDVEVVVYGWGRTPVYVSGSTAWPLDADLFARIYKSREPFWDVLGGAERRSRVYFLNDRAGIYAIGYPEISAMGHLMNLAELTALVAVLYVLLLAGSAIFAALARGAASGRSLLREIRASFYRKLFLAFVIVALVPVVPLALGTRAFIAARLRSDVELAAARTAAVAQRVVEDYATEQRRTETGLPSLNDDFLVWIGRMIDQDVNVFEGPHLLATSERDLFASGLLPTRTSADVYRAIELQRLPSFLSSERIGDFSYLLAAAPIRMTGRHAILTVPLTLRQQEIEREIDDLDRRILLAALVFVLVGAAIGYVMAERIADPVNRLTRAAHRIGRGDLDARIAATSSDELRRLVDAFNGMAAELQRQRVELARTERLEAWAEMARQVAHEIKNPLTPIQLSAEHLKRVHADRGAPLGPVLEACLDSIMSQVRLLRQIAGEFSSFASSPVPHPAPASLAELVQEVLAPYRTGLADRIEISMDVPTALPKVSIDRGLVIRALTNVVENAVHAMPGRGSLAVSAGPAADSHAVRITVRDTGVGMDRDALQRVFEPYFSTKAIGTGLGLTIAKRNVELSGGTIEVESEKGKGTTVTVTVPATG